MSCSLTNNPSRYYFTCAKLNLCITASDPQVRDAHQRYPARPQDLRVRARRDAPQSPGMPQVLPELRGARPAPEAKVPRTELISCLLERQPTDCW